MENIAYTVLTVLKGPNVIGKAIFHRNTKTESLKKYFSSDSFSVDSYIKHAPNR